MAIVLAPAAARADSISNVENARAKERQGAYLTREDREALRRYGRNDDWGYGPRYGYDYGYGYDYDDGDYDYGPSVRLYVGPGY
jgi:hypothetical protein